MLARTFQTPCRRPARFLGPLWRMLRRVPSFKGGGLRIAPVEEIGSGVPRLPHGNGERMLIRPNQVDPGAEAFGVTQSRPESEIQAGDRGGYLREQACRGMDILPEGRRELTK